ncbi:MAG TPA: NTP transferase domain-containing protein [Jatrophihabitantaceae bacterium]
MTFDAIVLAGGTARRLGGVDKPMLDLDGTPLLTRVLTAVAAARVRVVVGPRRPLEPAVVWCREQPPGGGPVAGLAAGLPHTAAPAVVVLAADLPWIAPAVQPLLAALDERHDVAVLRAGERRNYLAAAWRRPTLVSALAEVDAAGAAMRALVAAAHDAGAGVADVPDQGWGEDCDTWADLARARARSTNRS